MGGFDQGRRPQRPLTVDLARDEKGAWAGDISMPEQGAVDIPLSGISVQGDSVHFSMMETAGSPVFDGRLSADGDTISGTLSGGGESTPFEVKRSGQPRVKTPPPSSKLSPQFEGLWEGALEAEGTRLRLSLKLERGAGGVAVGTLSTLNETSPAIPITTITQNGNQLEFEIRAVAGKYAGRLNEEGSEISGSWTQNGTPSPLNFRRASK